MSFFSTTNRRMVIVELVAFATANWNDVIENNFTMSSLWLEDTLADCWTKTSIWQLLKEICLVTSKQLGNWKFFEKKIKLSANYDIFQMSALSRLMSNLRKLMCEVVNQFDSFAFSKQLGKFIALPGVSYLFSTLSVCGHK